MSDFTYDSQDFTAMRVASKDLQLSHMRASALALATGAAHYSLVHAKPSYMPRWFTAFKKGPLFFSLLTACLTYLLSIMYRYNAFTWRSRGRYDKAGGLINEKYSSLISRTLKYSE